MIKTPYYLIDKQKLLVNMQKIAYVREQSGAKALLALKCFATWSVFDLMQQYMDGTTSSSLYELKLGRQKFEGEAHAYSVAWADDAHVAERRAIFRAKRDRLNAFFVRAGYQVTGNAGAIYLWVRVPPMDPAVFFARLLEHGIVVSPGESFGAGGEGFFRIALVPNLDQIDRAIAVWETISL